MKVRPFADADFSAVVTIEAQAAGFPWPPSQFRSSLAAGHRCFVLEDRGAVVGFAIFSQVLDEASLLNIAVSPTNQGRGGGRLLLENALQNVAGRGAGVCFLEVRVSNHRARALYASIGFEIVGERKGYYPARNGCEDALVMSRALPKTFDASH